MSKRLKVDESKVLAMYSPAFSGEDAGRAPFLTFYSIRADKTLAPTSFTRTEFWVLAGKAAALLLSKGAKAGSHVVHYFTDNSYLDLAFRLAAAMIGTVPVTINWQADNTERVDYKIELTEAAIILYDQGLDAAKLAYLKAKHSTADILLASSAETFDAPLPAEQHHARLGIEDTRIIIFTSGTTGMPKGVRLPYRSYQCNRSSFEQFLGFEDAEKPLVVCLTNPMHHTNSTAISDWSLRRPGTRLHMFSRYSTKYWEQLTLISEGLPNPPAASSGGGAGGAAGHQIVAPLVSKHFDFLASLCTMGKMPVDPARFKHAMLRVYPLLGSAPVGPATVANLQAYAGKLPVVRFGSTETCLQVVGTPPHLSEDLRLNTFKRGWTNSWKGQLQKGYYIGRPHPPYTQVKVVKSIEPKHAEYMAECAEGEPGLLLVKGKNLMGGYIKKPDATAKAITQDGWYVNLGDMAFWRANPADAAAAGAGGQVRDYFWQSRDSALLIKGGSNYAYEQIESELESFAQQHFSSSSSGDGDGGGSGDGGLLSGRDFKIAVCGLKLRSEHEDDCIATVDLLTDNAKAVGVKDAFTAALTVAAKKAKDVVGKASVPDFVRFGAIPRNFKGAILVKQLLVEASVDFPKGSA